MEYMLSEITENERPLPLPSQLSLYTRKVTHSRHDKIIQASAPIRKSP
jgi:hypothetical protein